MDDVLFIEDGLTRPFFIERQPGIHGELRGKRLMMEPKAVSAYRRMIESLMEKKQAPAAELHRQELIAKQLVNWSAPKEITAANVAKLHPVILSKLEAIVVGVVPDGTENLEGDDKKEKTDADLIEETAGN